LLAASFSRYRYSLRDSRQTCITAGVGRLSKMVYRGLYSRGLLWTSVWGEGAIRDQILRRISRGWTASACA
jgi:hypothetical protein